jgi:integrase
MPSPCRHAIGFLPCPPRLPRSVQEGGPYSRLGAEGLRHTFVSVSSVSGVAVEEIAHLAGHASSRTTETIYRHELRPVITTGADVMDKIFIQP